MDIQQLRYYVSLAEELNYTHAAEKMYVSRQAIAQSVRQLETELGVKLVNSERGHVSLTPLGKSVYEEARSMLAEFDSFTRRIRGQITAQTESLRVICGAAVLSNFPSDMLLRFNMLHPNIMLSVTEANNAEMRLLLERHKADVCLMGTAQNYISEQRNTLLLGQTLTVLVNRQNPLAEKKELTIEDLRAQPMVGHGEAYDLHRFYVDACHDAGFEPRFSIISTNVDLISQLLQQNRSLCFATKEADDAEAPWKAYAVSLPLVLPKPGMKFGIYAVTPKDRPLTNVQKTFISFVNAEAGKK